MKTIILAIFIFATIFSSEKVVSCTIFYIAKDSMIFAGNNEDWEDPYTKMCFYPSDENSYGWIKFGFIGGFPQGGMNEYGLFWDGTSNAYLPMLYSEENKNKYNGALMNKIIQECKNVDEALEIFSNYYCEDQYKAQYVLGDSSGNSVIIEGDNYILKEGDFQVLTNFYQSHPELGGYPCQRYEIATEMLNSFDPLTTIEIGKVLAATHQDGKYPTQYSNIYDLKNIIIYLLYFHNYEEFITINLTEELLNGYREFEIPKLFSKIKLLSPSNGNKLESTTVDFQWEGIPDSEYEILYSTEAEFSTFVSVKIPKPNNIPDLYYFSLFFPLLFPFIFIKKNKVKQYYFYLIFFFIVLLSMNCKNENNADPQNNTIIMQKTIEGLKPETRYFWKIFAYPNYSQSFYSESIVNEFIITYN